MPSQTQFADHVRPTGAFSPIWSLWTMPRCFVEEIPETEPKLDWRLIAPTTHRPHLGERRDRAVSSQSATSCATLKAGMESPWGRC
jgi:hypothetical protein